jgi:hypothetical protein
MVAICDFNGIGRTSVFGSNCFRFCTCLVLDCQSRKHSHSWILFRVGFHHLHVLLCLIWASRCVSLVLLCLSPSPLSKLFFLLFSFLVSSFCATLAQVAVLNPFFTPFLLMFAGLVAAPSTMPKFWRVCLPLSLSLSPSCTYYYLVMDVPS